MKKLYATLMTALCITALAAADLTGVKIYINPGHGGYNGNDRSVATIPFPREWVDSTGFWESSSNLTKGLYLRDLLEASNATVYMSRTDNRSGNRDDSSLPTDIGDRPLTTIAAEASANNVDAFLSIHSNAAGASTAVNYLFLMCPGKGGEGDSDFRDPKTEALAKACWPYMWDNPLNVWTHYTATNMKIQCYVTSYTVIGASLTVPGFLSEGSFHDYKPETHRLLNIDYRKLEALRFFYFYCDYFNADKPATGVLCGDVRDANVRMTNSLYLPYVSGSKDQWAPINGAKVILCNAGGDTLTTYQVDTCYNGVFVFWDLTPGNYKLHYTADSYIEQIADVTVEAGKTVTQNVLLVDTAWNPKDARIAPDDYPTPKQDAGAQVPNNFKMDVLSTDTASWLGSLDIRRAIIKGAKMYVLTTDSRIVVADAVTGDSIAELSTAGVSEGSTLLSDIAFTSDTVLLACNRINIAFDSPTTYFKVYKWDNDTVAPELVFQSQRQGNWTTGEVGTTMAVSGPSWNFKLFTTSITTGSTRKIRVLGFEWDEDEGIITYKYMISDNYTEALWGEKMQFTLSPCGPDRFIVDSEVMQPTEYGFDWTVANREPLVDYGVMPDTDVAVTAYGANYCKYAGHNLMVAPMYDGTSGVGVALFDITDGVDSAKRIMYQTVEGTPGAVVPYMMAAAVVDGYDITVTLFAKNQGIKRYKTHTTDTIANIFASELKMEQKSDSYDFTFTLNENATAVTIQFVKDDVVVGSYDAGALTKGIHTVNVSNTALPSVAGSGQVLLNWQVKAEAESAIRLIKLSDDAEKFQFYNAYGLAMDYNTESDYFGRLYVASSKAGTCSGGRATTQGLYIFDAALTDITAQGNNAYGGGTTWDASSSPYRLNVAPDGRIFMCDYSDSHPGIWIADPANPSNNFTELFAGCSVASSGASTNANSEYVHGSISGCYVAGTGENTVLYTADEDYVGTGIQAHILQYNIGTATSWTQAPSAILYKYSDYGLLINTNNKMLPDGHGGWWISQYRASCTKTEPALVHFTGSEVDFHTGTDLLIANSRMAGMAVTQDGSRVATGSNAEINVWDVTYDADGKVSTFTKVFTITNKSMSGIGATTGDLLFDPAGNLYYISNASERLVVISLPKSDNTYTTAAPSSQTISVLASELPSSPTPVLKAYAYNGRLYVQAPVGERIQVYSITGQCVADVVATDNITSIALDRNQIVVVKAGTLTAKVIM